MTPKPTGTGTLLFSDIEDSTARLAELGADRYHAALEEHRRIDDAGFPRPRERRTGERVAGANLTLSP
jgi:hypothetical protein